MTLELKNLLSDDQLRERLLLQDRALSAAAEGIIITDLLQPGNPIIYVNPAFETITGYSSDDVLGKNCRFLQGPDTDDSAVEQIRHAIRYHHHCTVELLNYRKDGSRFWNRLSITPVRDDHGTTTHFIGVQSDITERILAEQNLQQAKADLETVTLRMKRNLQAAARIQQALLPEELPQVPDVNLAWVFRPTDELAGDILNIFALDEHRIAMYVLDVSGHGVPAALLSVTLSRWLTPHAGPAAVLGRHDHRKGRRRVRTPAEVVQRLNREFRFDPRAAQFFTILYAVLDLRTNQMTYVSAGHEPPILLHPDKTPQVLPSRGFPIGIIDKPDYPEHHVRLHPGDRLILLTDGVIEAPNRRRERYSMKRLLQTLQNNRCAPLHDSLQNIVKDVEAWTGSRGVQDDVSMIGVEILHKGRSVHCLDGEGI